MKGKNAILLLVEFLKGLLEDRKDTKRRAQTGATIR